MTSSETTPTPPERAPFEDLTWQTRVDGRVAFHPALASRFRSAGLIGLDQFFEVAARTVSDHRRTEVRLLELPATTRGDPAIKVYVKLHRHLDRKDVLRGLVGRGEIHSYAAFEWAALDALDSAGIMTPVPVALGERHTLLGEKLSFLVTIELAGMAPLDEVAEDLDARGLARVTRLVAGCIGRMHGSGLLHPDLYARHVYVDPGLEHCALIDVQRLRHVQNPSSSHRARDLAALDVSLSPRTIRDTTRLQFLALYLEAAGAQLSRRRVRRLIHAVLRRRQLLISRKRGADWSEGSS